MKLNLILNSSLVLTLTALLVACGGGDQRGENTTAKRSPLAGLWMAQSAHTDFLNPGDTLCASVKRHPSRHGLSMWRYGIPGVRIMMITNDGDVFRWSPSLRLNDPQFALQDYFVGRVGDDGVPTSAVYGKVVGEGMGTLRLLERARLAQIAGNNPFRVTRTRDGQTTEVKDPDLDFIFERVTEAQALAYLDGLRECEPRYFSPREESARPAPMRPDDGRPTPAPTAGPRPPKRERPALPATPPASREPIAPTGGYIPEDQWK